MVMPLFVGVPDLSGRKPSVKDSIITLLSVSWPLNAKKIQFLLRKERGISVSYQAVHKSLIELEEHKIVIRTGDDYQLGQDWVEKLYQFSQQLNLNYSIKSIPSGKNGLINLQFNSFSELEQFVLWKYTITFPNPEHKPNIIIWNHVWPGVGLSASDYDQLEELMKGTKVYAVCKGKTKLDKIWAKWLNKIGMKIKLGVEVSALYDIVIRGDYVFQVFLDKKLLQHMDETYVNVKNARSVDLNDWIQTFTKKKSNINACIIQNAELADQLRKRVQTYFK